MSSRSTVSSVVFALAAAAMAMPAGAQGVEYSPGTTRYRLSTTTKGSQTSPMGNQDFQIDARQQLTVNLTKPAKDTLVATVTLDSVSMKSQQGEQDLSRLIGSKFISYISPTGKVYSTKSAEGTDPILAQVTESVARFLPTYRRDLKKGLAWSDTSTGKVSQQGMDVDRTIVAHYKVLGDTTISGENAYAVERVSTVKAAGSGTTQGTPVALESATNSTAVFYLTPKGVYLGGRQNDDINVKITILAQNAEISIKQTAQSTIQAIK
jgi:hypothetical protein